MTAGVSTSVDEIVLLDNGAQRRKRFSEIFGSNAYNSTTIPTNNNQLTNGAGYTTNAAANNGTITINGGAGLNVNGFSFTTNQSSNQTSTLELDMGTLTNTTAASNAQRFWVGTSMGADYRIDAGNINISGFNNNSGFTTNTGTTTPSNSQTFTNKSGNISQWTNNSGYTTNTGTLTGNGTSGRVPIYNGSTSFTTDSGFTYASNILGIEDTLKMSGEAILSKSGAVLSVGDNSGNDGVEQILFKAMGSTPLKVEDGSVIMSIGSAGTEATSVMYSSNGTLGTRELGSNAFNSTSFTTMANGSNNRVVTATSSTGLNGESSLTFDGSNLGTTRLRAGNGSSSSPSISFATETGTGFYLFNSHDLSVQVDGSQRGFYNDNGFKVVSGGLGVNVNASTTNGRIDASNDVVAFSSDKRLKENIKPIKNALDKVDSLSGFIFNWNELAEKEAGFDREQEMVGVFAQDVESVLPQAVKRAPFDNDGNDGSISGENYLTVQYEKIVPLLIESIKELKEEIEELKRGR
jgi:hypothetical protein